MNGSTPAMFLEPAVSDLRRSAVCCDIRFPSVLFAIAFTSWCKPEAKVVGLLDKFGPAPTGEKKQAMRGLSAGDR